MWKATERWRDLVTATQAVEAGGHRAATEVGKSCM